LFTVRHMHSRRRGCCVRIRAALNEVVGLISVRKHGCVTVAATRAQRQVLSARSRLLTPCGGLRSSSATAESGRVTGGPGTASLSGLTGSDTRGNGPATGNTDTALPRYKTVGLYYIFHHYYRRLLWHPKHGRYTDHYSHL